MSYFTKVGELRFDEMLSAYAKGKDNLQAALASAVYQLIVENNPNWINKLFHKAGLWQSPINGKYRVTPDGRVIYAYLTTSQDDGGCGLSKDIIYLDREKQEWKLTKGRQVFLAELDMEFLKDLLDNVRFDQWGKTVVDKKTKIATVKYNPKLALSRVSKRMAESSADGAAGLDIEDVASILSEIETIRKMVLAAKSAHLKIAA